MDNITYVLYICFLVPMLMSLFILDSNARLVVEYILIGASVCLFISEINGLLLNGLGCGMRFFCTTVSPISEEVAKALPILFYAFFFSDNRRKLVQSSFALGLGFAILENMIMLTQNIASGLVQMDVLWALVRGFGAGLMHSVCTVTIGLGISFIRKKKKLFWCGTSSLLKLAITYHSIYNTIVISKYKYFGFVLPLATYIPILLTYLRQQKKRKNDEKVTSNT